jgi:hypothetical protein
MAKGVKHPQRQKSGDRMLAKYAREVEIRIDYAVAPLTKLTRDLDHFWGIDTLVEIVPPEMAEKFGGAVAKLNAAIEAQDVDEVVKWVGVCMRGSKAMHEAALASGAAPASDEAWLIQADDKQYALLKDGRAWQRFQDKHPDIEVVTERELILALRWYRESRVGRVMAEVKDHFPQAEVIDFKEDKLDGLFGNQ